MNKLVKRIATGFLALSLMAGTSVGVLASAPQANDVVAATTSLQAASAPAGTLSVSTFAAFKSAVEAGTPVQLSGNITATSNIGSTSKYIDKDITIYGNGYTLNTASYQFLLTGSHKISISDLTIQTSNSVAALRYGVFLLRAGSATTSNYVWDTEFHNFKFYGSGLLGVYNTDDYTSTKRYFNSAVFTGDTYFSITNPTNAYNGVVYARNVSISDTFVMEDNIVGSVTGANSPTYQHYFKSPGTGGVDSETNNNVANGSFVVAPGAKVTITRSPGKGTDGATSAYYRSLIFGYADHSFGEGASFYAKAGTNLTSSSDLLYRSAVIRSNNASSFVVANGANVKLETDLYNTTSAASKNGSYGFTALSLKKSGHLNIEVAENATLDIVADGRNVTPSYGTRAQAPVVIWGSGSSATTVRGNLNVYSENANGWYYAYSTSAAGKAAFTVEGTGRVDIVGNNLGKKGASEYAAFEAYGVYETEIIVRDGGKMNVLSNGYRGMSLAGAGGYRNKTILVQGAGSELNISGVHWAIAAETQPVLSISAVDGGKIDLRTTGEVGDGYSNAGSAPSTVYSVGPTTYNVDGEGSDINVFHSGGTYSAIFHDGYGPLKINVTNGGNMNVDSRNSGTDTSARRAAITAQSTTSGSRGSNANAIIVDGEGSALTVTNNNPYTHGNGGDTGLYPTGAISFNSSAQGNVKVSNGGSLVAVSSSLAPTVHLYRGTITFDNPGEFEIRNDSTSKTTGNNNTYATFGQAVYNERYRNTGNWPTAIEFKSASVTVWSTLKAGTNWAKIDNSWEDVSFTAKNGTIANVGKNGTGGDTNLALNQFNLSAYGRINGGPGVVLEKSAPPAIDVIYAGDDNVTGTGIAGSDVTVYFPNGTQTTVLVRANGTWTAPVNGTLVAGQIVEADQTEVGKSVSDKVNTVVREVVMQVSSPPAFEDVYERDETVSGLGIAGSAVTVIFTSPQQVAVDTVVAADGTWTVTVPAVINLEVGDMIFAYQIEPGKLMSSLVSTIVLERVKDPSEKPEIDEIWDDDTEITGKGIAGSDVTVYFPNGTQTTVLVQPDGTWSTPVNGTLVAGQIVEADQTEVGKAVSDKVSEVVQARPMVQSAPPEIEDVYVDDLNVTGKGIAGSNVTVYFPNGTSQTVPVDSDGTWSVAVSGVLVVGDVIEADQTEQGKLPSDKVNTIVKERVIVEQSARPVIYTVYTTSQYVYGTGVEGAEVTIRFPNGTEITTEVLPGNVWMVQVQGTLLENDRIYGYQVEPGKTPSPEVYTVVLRPGG